MIGSETGTELVQIQDSNSQNVDSSQSETSKSKSNLDHLEDTLYQDDQFFMWIRSFKRPFSPNHKLIHLNELVEKAWLERTVPNGISEQDEVVRVLSNYDPILWDLVNEYVEDSDDYGFYLKQVVLALEDNQVDISIEYDRIIALFWWSNMVLPKYQRYTKFLRSHYEPRGFWGICGVSVIGIVWLSGKK